MAISKSEKETENQDKVKATIVMQKPLWKEFKKLAIDEELNISDLLEKIVSAYIKRNG